MRRKITETLESDEIPQAKEVEVVAGESPAEMILLDEHFQTVAFLAKSLWDENRLRILLCVSKDGSGIWKLKKSSLPFLF